MSTTAHRAVVAGPKARQADLAAIHMAAKALGWDEDTYRDIMATVCGGIRSAGQLDAAGRRRFLAHLQACRRANNGQAAPKPAAAARRPLKPHEKKLWSLWMQLADQGLVATRTMKSLEAWCQRQTGGAAGVASIQWLNPHQRELCIESLKRWLARREEPTA